MADDLTGWLNTEARRLGFDAVGIAPADEAWPAAERLEAFVEAGYHGSMAWMQDTPENANSDVAGGAVGNRRGHELRPGYRPAWRA